ncbi:VanW family protein [Cellulomonas sp.]|uniref:VanW family protein n=1 Tax=Cellulomonas sp. TaxID=40001 RepID=UPI001B276BAE|nr:VanW family protein [Cellulomonas sp.]MBO9553362.1 VanW family protein [Cellulomonas sp.]
MTDGTDLDDAAQAVRPGPGTTDPSRKPVPHNGTMPHPHEPESSTGASDEVAATDGTASDETASDEVAATDEAAATDEVATGAAAPSESSPAGETAPADEPVATDAASATGDVVTDEPVAADEAGPHEVEPVEVEPVEVEPVDAEATASLAADGAADADAGDPTADLEEASSTTDPAPASSGPVWPVWGGSAGAAPAPTSDRTDDASDESASDAIAAVETASVENASGETGSDGSASDESGSDESGSDETASDETASDETASDETASDRPTPEVFTSEEASSDEVASDKVASDEAVSTATDDVDAAADAPSGLVDETATETVAPATPEPTAAQADARAVEDDSTLDATVADVPDAAVADAAVPAAAVPAAAAPSANAPVAAASAASATDAPPAAETAPAASSAAVVAPTPEPKPAPTAQSPSAPNPSAPNPSAPNPSAPNPSAPNPSAPASSAPAAPALTGAAPPAPTSAPPAAAMPAPPAAPPQRPVAAQAPATAPAPVAPERAATAAFAPPTSTQPPVTPPPAPPVRPPLTAAPTPAAPRGPFSPVDSGAPTSGPRIPSGPVAPDASGPERPASPLDDFDAEDGTRRWPRRLLVTAGVVVVLGAAYVGASYALADHVARGATVAGVDIGGLSSSAAVDRLESELADATTQPIPVVANDVQATIDPTAAGLELDAEATVATFTGPHIANPLHLWRQIVGEGEHLAKAKVDEDKLAAAVEDLTSSLALAPVDGTVVFVDTVPKSTAAVDGWKLDEDGAVQTLTDGWISAERPVVLPTEVVAPAVTQEETDAAMTGAARSLTSGPVSVLVADRLAMLQPATLAANASFAPKDGALVLELNGDGLVEDVLKQLPDLLTESADAHFEFQNDAPVIVPGTPGTSLDPAALAAAVTTASTASDRTAKVDLVQADPAESTAELEALGIKEIVTEFSTPLTSEPRRTTNISNGAAKITGTLVKPGETFSLTEALGPVDAAHGFVQAGAIISGEHTDAWGGGLSQLSTTTFNAAYLAGMEDVAHTPHSEWFARYPEGREATIFTGSIDMKWKNTTPYGALVQAWTANGRTYVRLWGTKYWTVESTTSARSGVVSPTTVYSQSPTCEASSAGNPGFSVTVTRKIFLNGDLQKTEAKTTRYKPQNKVVCGAPPAAPTP